MAITTSYSFTYVQDIDVQLPAHESAAAVVGLANGGFAYAVGDGSQTFIRAYDAAGISTGSNTMVGDLPAIAQLSDGNLITVSSSAGDIKYQISNPNQTNGTILATTSLAESGSSAVDVAALTGNRFVIVSQDHFNAVDNDVEVRIVNANGSVAADFAVDIGPSDDRNPTVAVYGSQIRIAWERHVGPEIQLWSALYSDTGQLLAAPGRILTGSTIAANPVLVAPTVSGDPIVYDTGSAIGMVGGAVTKTLTAVAGDETRPDATRLSNGMLVVAYQENDDGPLDLDTHLMLVDPASGAVLGDTLSFGSNLTETRPAIAAMSLGRIAAFADVDGIDIAGRIYQAVRITTGDAGYNMIQGDDLRDVIDGQGGDDLIEGRLNADSLSGGVGNDTFSFFTNDVMAGETIDGGADHDIITNFYSAGGTIDYTAAASITSIEEVQTSGLSILTAAQVKTLLPTGLELKSARTGSTVRILMGGETELDVSGLTLAASWDATARVEVVGDGDAETITGTSRTDRLIGNGGSDIFLISRAAQHGPNEEIDGGGEFDTIRFTSTTSGETLVLSSLVKSIEVAQISNAIGNGAGTTALNFDASAVTASIDIFGNAGANKLTGTAFGETIDGFLGSDTIRGGGGDDVLSGDEGDDIFLIASPAEHGANEIIDGGSGKDTIRFTSTTPGQTLVLSSAVTVEIARISSAGGDTAGTTALGLDASALTTAIALYGNAGDNVLTGTGFGDAISGGVGRDTIRGGAGTDTLTGGNNDDIFLIGAASEHGASESIDGGAGTDTIRFTATTAGQTLVLSAKVKAVEFARISNAAGSSTGTTALNISAAALTAAISLSGNAGANVLTGTAFADTIDGSAGNDTIRGGAGIDALTGGDNDDVFLVGSPTEHGASETISGGNGTDRIRFTSTTSGQTLVLSSLVSGVEFALISDAAGSATGTTALNLDATALKARIDLYGNNGANLLTGTGFSDTLNGRGGIDVMTGGKGDDIYFVDQLGDKAVESFDSGTDTVNASISYNLSGQHVEKLTLTGTGAIDGTGNSLKNLIIGNTSANVLNGLGDADEMRGDKGDDIYFVDQFGDLAVELVDSGTDTVNASISYNLSGQHVEKLNLTGTSAIDGTGNSLKNLIIGNTSANVLNGLGDADTLTGGGGADTFAFTTAPGTTNVDGITDFTVGSDLIALAKSIYTTLKPGATAGSMAASSFRLATAASTSAGLGEIIYNAATGSLAFDSDGAGAGAAKQFAQVSAGLALSASAFRLT